MKPIIEITTVNKTYNNIKALDNVSLKLFPNEILGFIGPNGAGKTTLIKSIVNLVKVDSGIIKVNDLDVSTDSAKSNAVIGYLPSIIDYYPNQKVGSLIDFKASFYPDNNISELEKIFPIDRNQKMHELSLGNKKKVGLILALAFKPKIIILDEPTSGLDPLMQQELLNYLIKEKEKGVSIFFSSHVLSEVAKIADNLIIIKEGKIIKESKMDDLLNDNYQQVHLTLLNKENEDCFKQINTKNLVIDNLNISFLYQDDINKLISFLTKLNLVKLSINDLDLDDIFIHYYEDETND